MSQGPSGLCRHVWETKCRTCGTDLKDWPELGLSLTHPSSSEQPEHGGRPMTLRECVEAEEPSRAEKHGEAPTPMADAIVDAYLEKCDKVYPDNTTGEDIELDLREPIRDLERSLSAAKKREALVLEEREAYRKELSAAIERERQFASVGGECSKCGFRYFAHKGHIILCPRCALDDALERERLAQQSLIEMQGDAEAAEFMRERAEAERGAAQAHLEQFIGGEIVDQGIPPQPAFAPIAAQSAIQRTDIDLFRDELIGLLERRERGTLDDRVFSLKITGVLQAIRRVEGIKQ